MAVLPIRKIGDPVLRRVAAELSFDQKQLDLHRLIDDLLESMEAAHGVGIAAPQIGISSQVAIINDDHHPFPVINPRITYQSKKTSAMEEGCLSVPGVFGPVRRPQSISVSYYLPTGQKKVAKLSGFVSRIFQHEADHLQGILFIDRAESVSRR